MRRAFLKNALWSAAGAVSDRAYSARFDGIAICSKNRE
jgi:hypothetical protein